MKVNEIFYSIQGESSYMGRPCVFIRLTGCHLRCSYCDTEYAFTEGERMSLDEIQNQVQKYECQLVEITGGEPLLQNDTPLLAHRLIDKGYQVLIETSGSIDVGRLDPRVIKIMDIKCPSSEFSDSMQWDNLEKLTAQDEVKFVIGNRDDYEWTKQVMNKYRLDEKVTVLLSPVFDTLDSQELAEWILQDRLNVRMQLQLHKYIWDPQQRGV